MPRRNLRQLAQRGQVELVVEFESLVVASSRLWPYDAIMLLVLRLFLPPVLLAIFPGDPIAQGLAML